MSTNLIFMTTYCWRSVDFTFQTPTALTYAVLNAKTTEERIEIIKNLMIKWSWDEEDIDRLTKEITEMLNDPTLKLGYI